MSSEAITRNDLKNVLDEVLPVQPLIPQIDEPVGITTELASSDGWTCPEYGIVLMYAIGNGSATGYYIQDNTLDNLPVGNLYDNSRANNTRCSTSFPVIKGHVYKQYYFAGQSRGAYYYKFK